MLLPSDWSWSWCCLPVLWAYDKCVSMRAAVCCLLLTESGSCWHLTHSCCTLIHLISLSQTNVVIEVLRYRSHGQAVRLWQQDDHLWEMEMKQEHTSWHKMLECYLLAATDLHAYPHFHVILSRHNADSEPIQSLIQTSFSKSFGFLRERRAFSFMFQSMTAYRTITPDRPIEWSNCMEKRIKC